MKKLRKSVRKPSADVPPAALGRVFGNFVIS